MDDSGVKPFKKRDTNHLNPGNESDAAELFLRQFYDGTELRALGIHTVRRTEVVKRNELSLEYVKGTMNRPDEH